MSSSRHLILNFNELSNFQISVKKLILTSPKLSEFHKKATKPTATSFFLRQENCYFVLGYHNVVCFNRISSSSQFEEVG